MSDTKKICLVVTVPQWGGAQRYVYDVACALKSKGYDVTVATGSDVIKTLLIRLAEAGIKTYEFVHVMRNISPMHDLLAMIEMAKYFREEEFDIVHLNSSKVGILGSIGAKLLGTKKIVFTAHGFVFNENQFILKKWLYIALTWFSFLCTDTIIAVSQYDKESALRYHVCSSQKIITIHNGIDPLQNSLLSRDNARKFFIAKGVVLKDTTRVIGVIANAYSNKGLSYVVEATERIISDYPDTVCVICGDGPEMKALQQMIAEKKMEEHIYLLGFVDEAEQYLLGFDVMVSASLKEGLPYSLIEARYAGVPIVATRVGGVPEIVDSEHIGILVPPADVDALAQGVKEVLARQRTERKVLEEKFLLRDMVQAILRVYEIIKR